MCQSCNAMDTLLNVDLLHLKYICSLHVMFIKIHVLQMSQHMRFWYLSHGRPGEPSLFAYMKYGSRRRVKPHWMAAHARLKNDFQRMKSAKIS